MSKRSTSEASRYLTHHHGTMPWRPTAQILLATATSNLRTYQDNLRIRSARTAAKREGAPASAQGKTSPTAFLARHLAGAATATEVLRAAIRDIKTGQKATSIETQIIYGDASLLRQALSLSERNGAEAARQAQARTKQSRAPHPARPLFG